MSEKFAWVSEDYELFVVGTHRADEAMELAEEQAFTGFEEDEVPQDIEFFRGMTKLWTASVEDDVPLGTYTEEDPEGEYIPYMRREMPLF